MANTLTKLKEICNGNEINHKQKDSIRNIIKENKALIESTQEVLKCVSGENRLMILLILSQLNEVCVNDLAELLNSSVSAISHQLRYLRELKLVTVRRCSQTMYYSINRTELLDNLLAQFGVS